MRAFDHEQGFGTGADEPLRHRLVTAVRYCTYIVILCCVFYLPRKKLGFERLHATHCYIHSST